jgi:hypothetical protein
MMKGELFSFARERVGETSPALLAPLLLVACLAACAPIVGAGASTADEGVVVEVDDDDAEMEAQLLELPDLNSFFEALAASRSKDRAAQESWEAERGFVSMSSIFARILDDSERGAARGDAHGAPGLPGSTARSYSARYPGMLRVSQVGLDMNVTVDEYARLVNKDGLVKIGDFIYQFTRDNVKAIGGGESRIALLKRAQSTNEALAIWVTPVEVKSRRRPGEAAPGSFSRGCESVSGDHRLVASEELIEWADPVDPRHIVTNYALELRSFQRHGTWKHHRTDALRASGWYEGSGPIGRQSYSFDTAEGAAVSSLRYSFMQDHQVFDPGDRPVVLSSEHHISGEGGTSCAIK